MTDKIRLETVSVRGPFERGRARASLSRVSLEVEAGVLAVIGARKDGTALLLDVIDGIVTPRSGGVSVLGGAPDAMRAKVARVSFEAPLPESLRVDEVCTLEAHLRGEAVRPAEARLGVLGVASLARRSVRTLTLEERRAVALALALTSEARVILVEEPLVVLDPVAPSLVADVLRSLDNRIVVVTTTSPSDALRVADGIGLLHAGTYASLAADEVRSVTMRVVVRAEQGKDGVAALVAALAADVNVSRVETATFAARPEAVTVTVTGSDLKTIAHTVTRAIDGSHASVELIEPITPTLDALRVALASRSSAEADRPSGGRLVCAAHEAPT